MIGFRSAGAFVASLIGAMAGLGKSEPVALPSAPKLDPRDRVVSAYCGFKGGTARARRVPPGRGAKQAIARAVAYDKHRVRRWDSMRTSTGRVAF